MKRTNRNTRGRQSQRGVVLVVALVFLLLLTILAISATGRSLLQQRMAGGLRNAELAEMGAETALRGAEWKLWMNTSRATNPPLICGSGSFEGACYRYDPKNAATYGPDGTVTRFRQGTTWTSVGAETYNGPGDSVDYTRPETGQETAKMARNPVYIIEDMGVELPPGTSGGLHESGATGTGGTGYMGTTRHVYRITARATGGNTDTTRVLESTFAAKGN